MWSPRGCLPCFAFVVASLYLAAPALAGEFRLLPSIAERLDYSDNIFLDARRGRSDFTSTTTGGLQILNKTERLSLDVSARVAEHLYLDNSTLNSTDQSHNGSIRYSLSPKLALSGRASYLRDFQPDRDIEVTGLVLSGVSRERLTFGLTGDYVVTDKTSASLSYDHGQDRYSSAGFLDYRYDTGALTLTHDLSRILQSTSGRLNVGYTQYRLTGEEIDNYEVTAGISYSLHEKWTLLVDAGPRYTASRFDTLRSVDIFDPFQLTTRERETNRGWGGVGQAQISYRGALTSASFTASRDIAPASGQSGTVERTAFSLSVNRRFSYEFRGLLSAGYFLNKSRSGEFSATPIDYRTINVTPGIRYDFNKDMFLEASYTFTRVENNRDNLTAYRNLLAVRFFVQHPIWE